MVVKRYLYPMFINPPNAGVIFIQSTRTLGFLKTVYIPCHVCIHRNLSYEYPFARVSFIFQVFWLILY